MKLPRPFFKFMDLLFIAWVTGIIVLYVKHGSTLATIASLVLVIPNVIVLIIGRFCPWKTYPNAWCTAAYLTAGSAVFGNFGVAYILAEIAKTDRTGQSIALGLVSIAGILTLILLTIFFVSGLGLKLIKR